MNRAFLCLGVVLAVLNATGIRADVYTPETKLPVLKTKIKTLAAFKNGLGFVFRSGETTLVNGCAEMEVVPPAAHGTFWVGSTNPKNPVEELVSYKRSMDVPVDAVNVPEFMQANIGKEMVVHLTSNGGKETTYAGKLISMPNVNASRSNLLYSDEYPGAAISHLAPARLAVFEVENDGKKSTIAVNWDMVTSLEIVGEANRSTNQKVEIASARIRLKDKPGNAEITVAYLQKGFNWSPSYLVDLLSDNHAQITMEAILANDVEDIQDTNVSLVVGYPSFTYADAITPLALNQAVGTFIQGLSRLESGRNLGAMGMGSVMQQSAMSNIAYSDNYDSRQWQPGEVYSTATNLPGESNEDLYFYKQDHVSLKKGERARYTVMTANVPMEHIYMLDIPDSSKISVQGSRLDRGSAEAATYQIWHALRMENTTGIPWTTAPAMAVKGALPLAQGMLRYTAPTTKTTLKLTIATDIRVLHNQVEESRRNVNIRRYDYSEVTVSGKISISNLKNTSAKINVLKSVVGKVTESGEGKTREVAADLNGINPTSEIQWEFDLSVGQSKELVYTYTVNVQ